MASVGTIKLMDETLAGALTGTQKALEQKQHSYIFSATTKSGAAGSFDFKLQHSPDGQTWHDLVTIPTIAGVGQDYVNITTPIFANVRAVQTNTGTGDVLVQMHYDK